METALLLFVSLLIAWFAGITLGAILRGLDNLLSRLTDETPEQHHIKSFKVVRVYFYGLFGVLSLLFLFGMVVSLPSFLDLLAFSFAIFFLLFALWGVYIGIGRRYIPPIQFLKMLRKW